MPKGPADLSESSSYIAWLLWHTIPDHSSYRLHAAMCCKSDMKNEFMSFTLCACYCGLTLYMCCRSESWADAVQVQDGCLSILDLRAAVCFEGVTSRWRVVDLGSAHGTFVDGLRIGKVQPSARRDGTRQTLRRTSEA